MYIDIHTHILPNVDDGAKSAEESLRMLSLLKQQGVNAVVLTPHFYPQSETSIEEYRERIYRHYTAFKNVAADFFDEILLGSEVLFFEGISTVPEISSLCIDHSKYILIELPYDKISSCTVNEIIELNLNCGLMPILAHIERYRRLENYESVLSLISDGYALGQVNAYSFLHLKTRGAVCRLVKDGYVQFVASDAHSVGGIPPRIEEAFTVINRKLGSDTADKLRNNSRNFYEELRHR